MKKETQASDVKGMACKSLHFQLHEYGEFNGSWTATAELYQRGGNTWSGVKDITLKLDETVATEIMRLLNPILLAKASKAAQDLADEAKAVANALTDTVQTAIEDAAAKTPTPTPTQESI